MLAGVSTRRYRRTQEPVGAEVERQARSTSKSAVSRTFVERTRARARRADEPPPRRRAPGGDDARRDRAEGPHQRGRARDHDRGRQDPARALGGLDRERDRRDRAARATWSSAASTPSRGCCSSIDGAKALRKAIRDVFGEAPVQRCIRHKERNVLDHLPERDRPAVKQRLRRRLGARRSRPRARPAAAARRRARPLAPRRRRLAARRAWRRRSRSPASASAAT